MAIPPETWFTLEIIAQGERYVVKVNGQTTADYRDPDRQFSTGRLALQSFNADTVVHFRKIEIKELPPDTWVQHFNGPVQSLAVSPNGKYVAVGVRNYQLLKPDADPHLLDRTTGRVLHQLKGWKHGAGFTTPCFSPDSKFVLGYGGLDRKAFVWNTATGELVHTLVGHTDNVSSASYASGPPLLLTTSWDRTFRLWDSTTGKELPLTQSDVAPAEWQISAFLPGTTRAVIGGVGKLLLVEFYPVDHPADKPGPWGVRLVKQFDWPGGHVNSLRLSSDGKSPAHQGLRRQRWPRALVGHRHRQVHPRLRHAQAI